MDSHTKDQHIAELLRNAAPMNKNASNQQIVSLAYGNVKLEDERVTREMIERALTTSEPNAEK